LISGYCVGSLGLRESDRGGNPLNPLELNQGMEEPIILYMT
jgi:hypothetical protein